ncbi:hypothetical protein WN944_002849 [Citrus x changshan-huyou]|uniref:Uncharacterized protein n=1 Tax=Citrus x changshan-huyou TaxID=2935761 RepID=A0AAP0MHA5_9ROSI
MVFRRASGEIRRKGGPRPCRSEPTGRWGREAVTHVKGMSDWTPAMTQEAARTTARYEQQHELLQGLCVASQGVKGL